MFGSKPQGAREARLRGRCAAVGGAAYARRCGLVATGRVTAELGKAGGGGERYDLSGSQSVTSVREIRKILMADRGPYKARVCHENSYRPDVNIWAGLRVVYPCDWAG